MKKPQKFVTTDVLCPDCGFPHHAKRSLREEMQKHPKVIFKCRACGFAVIMLRPDAIETVMPKKKGKAGSGLDDVMTAVAIASKGKKILKLFG